MSTRDRLDKVQSDLHVLSALLVGPPGHVEEWKAAISDIRKVLAEVQEELVTPSGSTRRRT